MALQDQFSRSADTFMGHGVFEARHLGRAAHRSSLPLAAFEALLGCLVAGWLDEGYPPQAVAAAEQATRAAYRNGSHPSWFDGVAGTG